MNHSSTQAIARMQMPDRAFSPAPIWWWSGDALDPQRLRWQLERFAAGHVYNVVILNLAPTGPLHGSLADSPHFLTAEWWQIFRGVCADARELGIKIWFYDQIGFSGANLQGRLVHAQPAFAGQQLASSVHECHAPTRIEFPQGSLPIGAWQWDGTAWHALSCTTTEVHSTLAQPHRVRLVYAVVRGFDYLNPAACLALRATVHEAFYREASEFFGDVIVGSFQDELPSMPTWSADFALSFAQHYGYDITAQILALFEPDIPDGEQVRIDYQRWRAHRCEAAFFRPFFDWHDQYGLLCGFDQQSPARMALPIGAVDEYADYLQTHRWYGAPGSDHHGNGKIHSSLAHLYEHPRSWIEAFHSSGWGGTLEETFDWLVPWLRAGLTLYNPHAVYYSTHGGWWEWAPPSTCWRQPYWQHYAEFADVIMRLTGVLSLGKHRCDIAVLFPTTTVQAHLTMAGPLPPAQRAEAVFVEITGSMFWNNPQPGILEQDRRDFDMIDDDSIARADIVANQLCVAGEAFRCIILPALTHLDPTVAAQLRLFAHNGGVVIAVETCPAVLRDCAEIRYVATSADVPAALAVVPRQVDGDCLVLERQLADGRLLLVTPQQSGSTFAWNGHWNSTPYTFDATRIPCDITMHIDAPTLEQWSVIDGRRTVLCANPDGSWTVSLADAPLAVLFVPDSSAATALDATAMPPNSIVSQRIIMDQDWHTEVVPVVENTWADLDIPASDYLLPRTMRVWDQQAQQDAVVGFGVYAWSHGPVPADQQPNPLNSVDQFAQTAQMADWSPVVYSLARGIPKDTLHWGMLGPKGYVPEEFFAFGRLAAGESVRVRTTFVLDVAVQGALVLAAPTAKRMWIDGVDQGPDVPGYQWMCAVDLAPGRHTLEFECIAEQSELLRGYWALTRDPEAFRRPIWMMQSDVPQVNTMVTFHHEFTLDVATHTGSCMLTADVPVVVMLDGHEIGRQGGFDPYGSTVRVQPHPLPALTPGVHTLQIQALDGGRGVTLLVDARCADADDRLVTRVMSGHDWSVRRGTATPVPATIRRRTWVDRTFDTDPALYVSMDPGWPLVDRRPHPLPQTRWLSQQDDTSVVPLVPDAYVSQPPASVFEWMVPVGATRMYMEVAGQAELYIDGVLTLLQDGTCALPCGARHAVLRLANDRPSVGVAAAAILAPIRYEMGIGHTTLPATFAELGLADYAGAMRCWCDVVLECDTTGTWCLEVAHVRGTLALCVNGQPVGTRLWSPYHFDITSFLKPGANTIELTITNTLAGYLDTQSPTSYTPAYQQPAGVMGSVSLVQYR